MALRPARIYKKWKRAYTRVSTTRPRKSYVKGIPGSKLRLFEMGNSNVEFDYKVSLVAVENVQIRHNALEAMRVSANSYLKKHLEVKDYFGKVRVFPHHILREHAQAAVAQADRFYDGMSHPFGKPSGTAARMRKGQQILTIYVIEKDLQYAKKACKIAGAKLPIKAKIVIE